MASRYHHTCIAKLNDLEREGRERKVMIEELRKREEENHGQREREARDQLRSRCPPGILSQTTSFRKLAGNSVAEQAFRLTG